MRRAVLVTTILYVQIHQVFAQNIWEQKVERNYVNFRNPLYGILKDFKNDFGIDFDYNSSVLPNRDLGPINLKGMKLPDAIRKVLKTSEVEMQCMGSNMVFIRKNLADISKLTEPSRFDFTLEGLIIEESTSESLPYASVGLPGVAGTTSNVDGYFTLTHVPTDTSTILIQYLGYKTKSLKLFPALVDKGKVRIVLSPVTTQLEEVIVSERKEHMMKATEKVSMISVSPKQLAGLPSLGEKDIFRSMQLLPGISATNETSSGLYVRGGTPDQNLVVFDGFNVYHVDHFYGFFSAFNANAVKNVQMYKGGFEAKYGGRLSSVVDLTGRDGNEDEAAGSVGLSLLSVNGTFETPILDNKGTVFFAARRSYTDIIRSGLYNDIFGQVQDDNSTQSPQTGGGPPGGGRFARIQNEPSFYFYDLNAKVTYRPNENDNIEYSIYSGKDQLDNSNDFDSGGFGGPFGGGGNSFSNETVDITDWGNVGTSLKWSRQWNQKLFSNNIVSYSNYFSNRNRYSGSNVIAEDSSYTVRTGNLENNDVRELNFKTQWEYEINPQHSIGFGSELLTSNIDYLLVEDDTTTILNRKDNGFTTSFYVQDEWKPTGKLTIIPGLRTSLYSKSRETYFEPRLAATYQLTDKLKLKAATGLYHQFVTRVVREDITQGNRDFWILADDDLNPVSSATHYIAGASYETENFLFDVEAYHKELRGLSEYTLRFSTDIQSRSTEVSELFYQGNGYSRGIEFLAQKKFGKHTGWISYTLSETVYDFPDLSPTPYYALHDQTHEFKLIENIRFKNWTFGGTWIFATGKPYTQPIGSYELTLIDGSTENYISVGDKNGQRLPSYHRLDISASHDFKWGNSEAQIGVSIFNLYNNTNVWYKTYQFIDDDLIETNVTTLGFTPNFFFNIKF